MKCVVFNLYSDATDMLEKYLCGLCINRPSLDLNAMLALYNVPVGPQKQARVRRVG